MTMTGKEAWAMCLRLLQSPDVSEIESNGPNDFFLKKSGKRIKIKDIQLDSEEEYIAGIEAGLVPHVRQILPFDRNSYLFEGPLHYETSNGVIRGRCHIVLPPASDAAQVTIAKKSTSLATLDAIASKGSMSFEMLLFMKAIIEADLTIVFSGGTGAGKALHRDTRLPTPDGWKTVNDVSEGDLLYDDKGLPTRVVKKYCPEDPESFEVTFRNGETVRTSAGHLWEVVYQEGPVAIVSTREMFDTGVQEGEYLNFRVNRVKNDVANSALDVDTKKAYSTDHYVASIKKIEDDPRDYYCFQVDSESHLFLCTDSLIPTHNTTMLEACTKLIPDSVRIGVAEDTPELSLIQSNVSYLHSVPWQPGMDPNNVATLSWVVQQFQRMRTDRLIIGETRGKEFADFLIAANSGMDGSMTTIHANTPIRCLDKMSNFAMKGSDRQPTRSINADIGNAVDIIVQLIILPDGRHKIDAIQEITPIVGTGEDAKITTSPLYKYDVISDKFEKKGGITDDMRKRFASKGVSSERFSNAGIGEMQDPHSELNEQGVGTRAGGAAMPPQNPSRPRSGLPTRREG